MKYKPENFHKINLMHYWSDRFTVDLQTTKLSSLVSPQECIQPTSICNIYIWDFVTL